jgi:hypothetical protein
MNPENQKHGIKNEAQHQPIMGTVHLALGSRGEVGARLE